MDNLHLIKVWRGLELSISAPYINRESRDKHAIEIMKADPDTIVYRLDIEDGVPRIYSYLGKEVEEFDVNNED